ncbi:hypothetical protein ACFQ0K_11380 [Nocardioides caeni]|uniref:Uncharacterized protein n=1 Tax=Nocardioides caeni TaxID=574700 RepID=A0A4S8NNX3_9ACTN|nr:hypothetical protein [Nocardioides caeni]THV17942.1 hypothetical protein E9934_05690 [Nocardioides caeni]
MRRRTSLVTAVVSTVLLAAGCGLTDEGPRPGVAAEVDGESLQLEVVDRTVEDYCTLLAEHPDEQAFPTALIRTQLTLLWSRSVAIDAVATDHGVPVPGEVDESEVRAQWEALGEIDDDNLESFTWLADIQARDEAMIEAIGTAAFLDETGQPVVGEDAWNRGNELVALWLDHNQPHLNPVFGDVDWSDGTISADALSVPVSDEAVGLVDISAVSAERLAELPASQRCGPEPQDEAAAVPIG